MSWLDPFVIVEVDGVALPARRTLALGEGLTAVDDPDARATVLEATAQEQPPASTVVETARVYNVGQATWMYPSIAAAVAAINAGTAPSSNDPAMIQVWPGVYSPTSLTVPAWTTVKGASQKLVTLVAPSTDLFVCGGNNSFEDMTIIGNATPLVYAFDCNNTDNIALLRIAMTSNGGVARQRFLKQNGATWVGMTLDSCRIVFGGIEDYPFRIQNTSVARRDNAIEIRNTKIDARQLTTWGGGIHLTGVHGFDFVHSDYRGTASWGTGIRHHLGSLSSTPTIDVRHSFLDVGVPVYNEPGTHYNLMNCQAAGALAGGTRSNYNSHI